MRALNGETMLAAWERCLDASHQRAALAVLALAEPEREAADWARLPLGERNALLLELRAASIGRRMEGFATCPECGERLEFTLDAQDLAQSLRALIASARGEGGDRTLRPVDTLDLIAAGAAGDEAEARDILLARTLRMNDGGADDEEARAAVAGRWLSAQPPSFVETVSQVFDSLNASAEVRAQFHCAACGNAASVDLDVAHFVLDEIARAARRLMIDIHELAGAYGWSEHAIAAMSAVRRSAYLELLRE